MIESKKKNWSDLSDSEKEKFARIVAQEWVSYERQMVKSMITEALTPFWVRWARSIKNKFKSILTNKYGKK